MRTRWRLPVILLLVTALFWLLLNAAEVREAVLEGLLLCGKSIIPSLFPFLAVSTLLMELGFGEALALPLSGWMGLYHIGGAGASALILGLVGGYPIGARTTAQLYRDRLLSRNEAERLLSFVNNANPAFFISVLGMGVFHSLRVGLWLWLLHLLAALLTGLILGRRALSPPAPSHRRVRRPPSRSITFASALVSSVSAAMSAMLSICAFVVFFYVLALPLRTLSGIPGLVVTGLTELFSATPMLPNSRSGFILASGLAGWGGLSVQCQTLAVLDGSGLSTRNCWLGKALQGVLSTALATIMATYVVG